MIRNYIIVDDDPFNNTLCNLSLESALGDVDIQTFDVPEDGLKFIQNEYLRQMAPTVLFLDINMPTLTGWEFMEEYEQFDEAIKKQIVVYMLSSSVDQRDKDKAEANNYIKGFISKPLNRTTILSIANG